MPATGNALIRSEWIDGNLVFKDLDGNEILKIAEGAALGGSVLPTSKSTITLGTPTTTQTATIQLKDAGGNNIADVRSVRVYMATDAAGATPSSAGPNGNVTASTGAIITALEAKLNLHAVTDANGVLVLSFDNAGGGGVYTDRVVLVLPSGDLVVSAALAVATS